MSLDTFIRQLRCAPDHIAFDQTIGLIDSLYDFTPTAFRNGKHNNNAGENTGSCKILAFAQLNGLSVAETLACFGHYYRDDVRGDPNGSSHANIREFMRLGWPGVHFAAFPLQPK